MTWQEAVYACEDGCEHHVTLGKLPVVLMIEHGVSNFKVPSCINPLVRIQPECTEAEIDAYAESINRTRHVWTGASTGIYKSRRTGRRNPKAPTSRESEPKKALGLRAARNRRRR